MCSKSSHSYDLRSECCLEDVALSFEISNVRMGHVPKSPQKSHPGAIDRPRQNRSILWTTIRRQRGESLPGGINGISPVFCSMANSHPGSSIPFPQVLLAILVQFVPVPSERGQASRREARTWVDVDRRKFHQRFRRRCNSTSHMNAQLLYSDSQALQLCSQPGLDS